MLYVNSIPCLIYQREPYLSSVYLSFNTEWLRDRQSFSPRLMC
jgi:hypothetical protein